MGADRATQAPIERLSRSCALRSVEARRAQCRGVGRPSGWGFRSLGRPACALLGPLRHGGRFRPLFGRAPMACSRGERVARYPRGAPTREVCVGTAKKRWRRHAALLSKRPPRLVCRCGPLQPRSTAKKRSRGRSYRRPRASLGLQDEHCAFVAALFKHPTRQALGPSLPKSLTPREACVPWGGKYQLRGVSIRRLYTSFSGSWPYSALVVMQLGADSDGARRNLLTATRWS